MSQDNSGKKSKRSKAKYPALTKKYNLKMRSDYIETDYVNGVRNEHGEMVIRPLNSEEKKFLNNFYEETIIANFEHHPELKELGSKIRELKQLQNPTKKQLEEFDYLQFLYFQVADDELIYSNKKDQKKIYGENNARNRCLYNRNKAAGRLFSVNNNDYSDELEDYEYYDCNTGRNIYIDPIEYQRLEALKRRDEEE